MSDQRDQLQPYLEALNTELQTATGASRQCRFSRQFVSDLLDELGGILDDLDDALAPHDERLQEARKLLRRAAVSLLGPGDREPAAIVDAAVAIRDAAGVAHDADINLLLQEIAAGAQIYARPEYGPKSRWQALRDQITDLTSQLADAATALDESEKTVEAIRTDLEAEQLRTATLTDGLEKETNRSTRDGLTVVQLRETLKAAEWNPDLQRWMLTDEERTAALDA